jgi:hypothetical protein
MLSVVALSTIMLSVILVSVALLTECCNSVLLCIVPLC